jgi:hypothetical protein
MSPARRVAAITAWNPGNAGMYSVDRAALDFFRYLDVDVTYFVPQTGAPVLPGLSTTNLGKWLPHARSFRSGDLSMMLLENAEQLREFDVVVYWGDFLNNPVYGRGDFCNRDVLLRHSTTKRNATDKWFQIFTGSGVNGPKLISAGNNFQHEFRADWDLSAIREILKRFSHVFPRDHYSTRNLLRHADQSSSGKISQGLDMALLQSEPPREQKRFGFSYFFGRSIAGQCDPLISEIAAVTGEQARPLQNWHTLRRWKREARFLALRQQIASSAFCVTDTYHVAVNCLAAAIPVIGLGMQVNEQVGTLGDFKKMEFFKMFDLCDYYLEADSRVDLNFVRRVAKTIKDLRGEEFKKAAEAQSILKLHRCEFRQKLAAAVLG